MQSYEHQVAGHQDSLFVFVPSTSTPAAPFGRPLLAKALPHCKSAEETFLALAADSRCPLHPFVPSFHGTLEVDPEEVQVSTTLAGSLHEGEPKQRPRRFLLMENVLSGIDHPTIADVKLGTRLYAPDASPEKRRRMEEQACITTSGSTGLRICGLKVRARVPFISSREICHMFSAYFFLRLNVVFDPSTHSYVHHTRAYGRALTPATLASGFAEFLRGSNSARQRRLTARAFRQRLSMLAAALEAVECRLYGCSVLLAYNGRGYDDDVHEGAVVVRLIDFAHSFFCAGEGCDDGALLGLKNLICIFGQLEENSEEVGDGA
ncbi:hypothetical protein HDU82_004531 [Entophlyctis luteolus]|nr:hypothetical protein HDU82_004531 [Entophlyctis luteolus]